MKIAIIGYGKMGREIEKVAQMRQHEICGRFTSEGINQEQLAQAHVAIEFTHAAAAVDNIRSCLALGIPVAVGTTGWYDHYEALAEETRQKGGSLLCASNFSLGVNLFFALNERLAALLAPYPQYRPAISETHHLQKKDAPSGTAIQLAQQALQHLDHYQSWSLVKDQQSPPDGHLPISAYREADVPGTHQVRYDSTIDRLQIEHQAHNRQGFALGSVIAAEFIAQRKGVFTMKDVINI
jgi:4-hydroxy-tetrahydrodipicolinate reductase